MLSTTLLLVIISCWLISLRVHGAFSLVSAGLVGFTTYSIPAVVGLTFPFHLSASPGQIPLVPASSASIIVILLAWLSATCVIAIPRKTDLRQRSRSQLADDHSALILALLLLSILGLLVVIATDGPWFFLNSRSEQTESLVKLLWRWVNSIGLIVATLNRSWRTGIVFLVGLGLYFVAGDRTIPAITIMGICVILGRNQAALRAIFRPAMLATAALSVAIIIFGKAIYLSIKAGSAEILYEALSPSGLERALKSFEPFATHNILDLVVQYDFSLPLSLLLEGIVGQLMVMPSAFGFESNAFNREFTSAFASMLSYGVAGNFWAQAYSIGGYGMVVIYSVLFATILRVCDRGFRHSTGVTRILFIMVGALFAVYAHRNSLDNILSFVRQIILVVGIAFMLARLMRLVIPHRARARSPGSVLSTMRVRRPEFQTGDAVRGRH